MRFENLSGDASLEWTGRAASELLSRSLSGAMDGPMLATVAVGRMNGALGDRSPGAPGISSQRVAAQLSGATRMITGYVERNTSGIRATAVIDDLITGKRVQSVSVLDATPMKALTGLARAISSKAGPYETSSEEALRLYCVAAESSVDTATSSLEQAIQKDPAFGPAWEALIQIQSARGDRPAAESLLARARQQKLEPLTFANLDLEEAVLLGDQKAKLAALRKVSSLSSGDTVLRRSLAESETAAAQFAEAAADWEKLRQILTTDPDVWNQLGYTQAWSGNYAGAVTTMEGYVKLRPEDPNPLDSLGDVHYMYRKFSQAAEAYQKVCTKFPQFQAGGDFYKLAWAKFMAGDKAGAEKAFGQFRQTREKNGNISLAVADWLYRTGRPKEAIAELRKAVANAGEKSPEKASWLEQLAIWDLITGDRATAVKDAEAAGAPATPGAFLVRFVTMPSAPASDWEARAQRFVPNPGATTIRQLALGYALLLDGKKDASLPVWKQLAESAQATDFTMKASYVRVRGEKPERELLPDPNSVNPFGAVLDAQSKSQ